MTKKDTSIILCWGAIWGLEEATLGHILHSMSINIGWLFWFPLAFYFMHKAYRNTGKTEAIIYTAFIAAGIKLIDLLVPAVNVVFVIYPAISILLEGLTVFVGYKMMQYVNQGLSCGNILFLNIGWRLLFIPFVFFLPLDMLKTSIISGPIPFAKFFVLESIANSLTIYAYLRLAQRKEMETRSSNIVFTPGFTFALLIFTIAVQYYV